MIAANASRVQFPVRAASFYIEAIPFFFVEKQYNEFWNRYNSIINLTIR